MAEHLGVTPFISVSPENTSSDMRKKHSIPRQFIKGMLDHTLGRRRGSEQGRLTAELDQDELRRGRDGGAGIWKVSMMHFFY